MSTAETAVTAPASARSEFWKGVLWNFAHLAVLSAFAIAQPLFNLLSDNPEFFAARGAPSFDVISFGLLAGLEGGLRQRGGSAQRGRRVADERRGRPVRRVPDQLDPRPQRSCRPDSL